MVNQLKIVSEVFLIHLLAPPWLGENSKWWGHYLILLGISHGRCCLAPYASPWKAMSKLVRAGSFAIPARPCTSGFKPMSMIHPVVSLSPLHRMLLKLWVLTLPLRIAGYAYLCGHSRTFGKVQVPGRSLIALGGVMCIWHPSSATYTPLIPIRIRHVPSQRLTLLTMVHSVFEIYATYTY